MSAAGRSALTERCANIDRACSSRVHNFARLLGDARPIGTLGEQKPRFFLKTSTVRGRSRSGRSRIPKKYPSPTQSTAKPRPAAGLFCFSLQARRRFVVEFFCPITQRSFSVAVYPSSSERVLAFRDLSPCFMWNTSPPHQVTRQLRAGEAKSASRVSSYRAGTNRRIGEA